MEAVLVNGRRVEPHGPPERTLLACLRGELDLTGAKPGCGEGECGACTVLVDGAPVLACQTSLAEVAGHSVTTIEGLSSGDRLHPVQQAFVEERASQCGYCTPAMVLRATALLEAVPDPDDAQIAEALGPSLCRCGCYPRITRAVHRAAMLSAGAEAPASVTEPGGEPRDAPTGRPTHPPPPRPWDLCAPEEREWFDLLGDGLVAVWPPETRPAGMWPANGGAFVHVGASGAVTAFSGKADVGQDNTTAFRLIVAEELGISPVSVRAVLGDTDLCPFDVGTFGSRSMPDAGEALRLAAAGAREALARLASERWEVDPSVLGVADGCVTGGPEGSRLSYAELLRGEQRLEVLTDAPAPVPPSHWRLVGHAQLVASRRDAVTGARRFASDLTLGGMLHGAVLRPPVRGATLLELDTRAVEQMAGVTLVRDGDLVAVAAEDPGTARRAIGAVQATWAYPPPGPDDPEGYLRAHLVAGQGWERELDEEVGDVEDALGHAVHRLDATYSTAYLAHVPLETRAALAAWEGERLTVTVGTQTPFRVRAALAEGLAISEEDVRVIVPPTGGAFGGKHAGEVALEAALIARGAGRPVRVHWSRSEETLFGYLRPMAVIDIRAGTDEEGRICAFDFVDVNAGAAGIAFPYRCANRHLAYRPATSPVPQGSYRALAATANHFARESHIDELARAVGLDPLEFRLGQLDDERLATVLREAASRFGWSARHEQGSSGTGYGVAAGVEKGGRVATCAEVRVDAEGAVSVVRLVTAYECGAIVNPDTVENQVAGGTVMALGGALFEQVVLERGRVARPVLSAYRVPRFTDIPEIEVVLLDRSDLPSAGAGETPLVAVAPAIANAIRDASGLRLRSLPLVPSGTISPESADSSPPVS